MKVVYLFLIVSAMLFTNSSYGQMADTDGPTTAKKEKQLQQPTRRALTKDIEKYIQKEIEGNGGYFLVYDSIAKKQLKLKLIHVHTDKFANIGNKADSSLKCDTTIISVYKVIKNIFR